MTLAEHNNSTLLYNMPSMEIISSMFSFDTKPDALHMNVIPKTQKYYVEK